MGSGMLCTKFEVFPGYSSISLTAVWFLLEIEDFDYPLSVCFLICFRKFLGTEWLGIRMNSLFSRLVRLDCRLLTCASADSRSRGEIETTKDFARLGFQISRSPRILRKFTRDDEARTIRRFVYHKMQSARSRQTNGTNLSPSSPAHFPPF